MTKRVARSRQHQKKDPFLFLTKKRERREGESDGDNRQTKHQKKGLLEGGKGSTQAQTRKKKNKREARRRGEGGNRRCWGKKKKKLFATLVDGGARKRTNSSTYKKRDGQGALGTCAIQWGKLERRVGVRLSELGKRGQLLVILFGTGWLWRLTA